MEFKIVIAGGRYFDDQSLKSLRVVREAVDSTISGKVGDGYKIIVISGCARGADRLGELYAKQKGYEIMRFPANWNLYGDSAGVIRNEQMAKVASAVIAFWDGRSTGTLNMIQNANKYGLPLRVFDFNGKRHKEWEANVF